MKLTIVGTGYVGLVTGTCFAEVGHQVVCVDNDPEKIKLLEAGGMPIYEPGLEALVKQNVAAGRLRFSNSTAEGVRQSDVIFIAVPTPPQPDGSVDLSFIEKVARDIASELTDYRIVVDKSTVPVRTGDKVAETIKRYCKSRVEFDVVSNPEFLREGFAVGDFMKPDRVVIGVLGLAFKQNTDDVRMSPAIDLCQRLLKEGARLRVHDPQAMSKARAVLPDVTYVDDMNAVAEGCDALVVATEWPEFRNLDLHRARKALTHPILFDGRNLFDPVEMEQLGFIYKSVGR